MKILVFTKRQYTNLDLLDDRFGRLREIPLSLAKSGHKVAGICLSYRNRKEGTYLDGEEDSTVQWQSLNMQRLLPLGRKIYWREIENKIKQFKPDLIWACSDALHAIVGAYVAKKYGIRLVVDLYDNFESFYMTRLPGVRFMFRKALQSAHGVTCVSEALRQYIRHTMSYKGLIQVIENAVPEGQFYPMNQVWCRKKLGLPEDGLFIGSAGHVSESRGIETLFRSFEILARERADVHLVLAGPCDKGLSLPQSNRFHYFGPIPPSMVPVFISSLDVNVICNRNSAFGRYCFPQKFYEAVECKVPVVAAEVGAMKELLKTAPRALYMPEDVDSLVTALRHQLENPDLPSLKVPGWNELGFRVGEFFEECLMSKRQ